MSIVDASMSLDDRNYIFEKDMEFWKNQLFTGEISRFPYDQVVDVSRSENPYKFFLPEDLVKRLNKISNNIDGRLYILLTAAFITLLGKYTNTNDVRVGIPIYKQKIKGDFINTSLLLRTQFTDEISFKELIFKVRDNIRDCIAHQNSPLNRLLSQLSIPRRAGRYILFDTAVMLDTIHEESYLEQYPSSFKLIFSKGPDSIFGIVRYNQCFKAESIKRIVEHYLNILEKLTSNPDVKLKEVSLASEYEQRRVLYEFNDTVSIYSEDQTIQELFEEQVARTPDKTMLIHGAKTISYRELNKRANSLARVLRKMGVKPDCIVGIMSDASIEMIIGIIGVLKAGGAYLPIDLGYPEARIRYMLEDSGVNILMSVKRLARQIEFKGSRLYLDDQGLYYGEKDDLKNVNKPDDLVYVIYTSGSTGKPKGVMIEHKSLVNLCRWQADYYGITQSDINTQYAGVSFDASLLEIFPCMCAGCTLHILNNDIKLDVRKLNEYLEENGISVSFLPTQVCERFMEIENRSLRKLLTGGDKLNYFIKRDYDLVNNYGPTECTVVTTSFVVNGQYKNIPIGKPIHNTKVYILDRNDNLQPVGVPGELCVSGAGLARGYLNRPELTKEKFVVNPFAPGERMYRTGDIAKWLPDGNLQFMGRKDDQIKIRGFRIETGEIESQLLSHENIKEAVVVTKEDDNGDKRLCAYIVSDKELFVQEFREYLGKRLPDYMIPAYFVQMENIPLTPSGKINRPALPAPEDKINTKVEYVAPIDEVEENLVLLWQEILGIERVGTKDNIFDLGADSIKATKLVSRLNKEFNVELPVMEIFKTPTIAQIAQKIKKLAKAR